MASARVAGATRADRNGWFRFLLSRVVLMKAPRARRPEVSVIIPTRNRWELVGQSVTGALRQEDVDAEVVLVDDGSTDPMPEGAARARNLGIEAARGAWLAFLDDDDLWSPRKLRTQLDAAARAGADFVYGSAVVVGEDLRVRHEQPAPDAGGIAREILVRNAIPGGCSNVTARSELVRRVGGFDESLSVLADWDLWIRLALHAPAAACPEVLLAYLSHPGNMVVRGEYDTLREFRMLEEKHRAASLAEGVRFDRRRVYRYFARGHRRAGRRVDAARTYLRLAAAERSLADAGRALGALAGLPLLASPRAATRRRRLGLLRANLPAAASLGAPAWLALYQ
jgi:glycosyltransferase involved in cell wall biosynthesis